MKTTFLVFLMLLIYLSTGFAQVDPCSTNSSLNPVAVTLPDGTSDYIHNVTPNQAYSPSITGWRMGGISMLAAAYAYTWNDGTNLLRGVAISLSDDGGATWTAKEIKSEVTTSSPTSHRILPSISGNRINLDDPEIMYLGTDNENNQMIAVVVRAWDASTVQGEPYQEQPGSIFNKCGIFMILSSDGGNTWGHWSPGTGNTWVADQWQKIADNTSTNITLEHPRVATRPEYDDNVAYVVWGKRNYNEGYDGTEPRYILNEGSRVGIAAIDIGDKACLGKLFTITGSATPLFKYLDFTIPNNHPVERPSVAIAPDSTIWVAFYSLDWPSTFSNPSSEPPEMKIFCAKGFKTINASAHSINIVFDPDAVLQTNTPIEYSDPSTPPDPTQLAYGTFDFTRGYVYRNHFPAIGGASPIDPDKDINMDCVGGPSIQVVQNPPQDINCNFKYHVGIAHNYSVTNRGDWTHGAPHSEEPYSSIVGFYSFMVKRNPTSNSLSVGTLTSGADIEIEEKNYRVNDSSKVQIEGPTGNIHPSRFFLFPTLKFVRTTTKVQVELKDHYPEYFVLGCYGGDQFRLNESTRNRDTGPFNSNNFKYLTCFTGISYDNKTFHSVYRATPLEDNRRFFRPAECVDENAPGWIDINNDFMGTKVGVTGEIGELEAHVIWHQEIKIKPDASIAFVPGPNTNERLLTNVAHGILVKPYLSGYPFSDSRVLPLGPFFDEKFASTSGMDYKWGDYGYFEFNDLDRPDKVVPVPSITFGSLGTFNLRSGDLKFVPIVPASASSFPYGLRFAMYSDVNNGYDYTLGDLGFSDQRRFVTTDSTLHAVYIRNGTVFYNFSIGTNSYSNQVPQAATWAPEKALSTFNSDVNVTSVSMAVYEEGSGEKAQNFDGKSAIAVTWVENNLKTHITTIYMRTKEFNSCEGFWGDWSPTYTIHSHLANSILFQIPILDISNTLFADDNTKAVIAPLVKYTASSPSTATTLDKSNLLGWNIIWTVGEEYFGINGCTVSSVSSQSYSQLCSRTWLRANNNGADRIITNNDLWGHLSSTGITYSEGYMSPSNTIYMTGKGFQPQGDASLPTSFNILAGPVCSGNMFEFDFPTATSREYKYPHSESISGNTFSTLDNSIDVAFSTRGDHAGIYAMNTVYNTKTTIGAFVSGTALENVSNLPVAKPGYSWDRNPCITVNSSGQSFITWERMVHTFNPLQNALDMPASEIRFANRVFKSNFLLGPWTISAPSTPPSIQTVIVQPRVSTMTWDWLRNPSCAGFPRSQWADAVSSLHTDKDPANVDLLYWQENAMVGLTKTPVNRLLAFRYNERALTRGFGKWNANVRSTIDPLFVPNGANAQRSSCVYNFGPTFRDDIVGTSLDDAVDINSGGSYGGGNTVSLGSIQNTIIFQQVGTPKGTYETKLPYELYRRENIIGDSASITFGWGKVYVGDTNTSLPLRQVKLHWGVDSLCMTNASALRDSIFSTEIFDFPIGSTLSYWRGFTIGDSLTATTASTLPGFGGIIQYIIELVNDSGSVIHTLETLTFNPLLGQFSEPGAVSIINGSGSSRNVYIRVRGIVLAPPMHSYNNSFEDVFALDDLTSYSDTSFTIYKKGFPVAPLSNGLSVYNPYPNPIHSGESTISIPFFYPENNTVSIQLIDVLGRIIDQKEARSSGEWQNIDLQSPKSAGTFFVRVRAGNDERTKTIQVY